MLLPSRCGSAAKALARELKVSTTAAEILIQRGYAAADDATRFLEPKLARLTRPGAMIDRDKAAARLARAVRARERVCIFGDYDADGITSAALLTDVLRTLGGNVVTVLADRFDGGYGFSREALARVRSTSATLVVTCDCGTSDHERLDEARKHGIDVIVIDHHRVPQEALPAFAFLNPHRPDCGFPYKGLASVGLALSICAGIRTALGVTLDVRLWLDLVALGTIADVAPLDGDNRLLVRAGLALLATGGRPGVRVLTEAAHQAPGYAITAEDVSYRYAPRINAPGRLAKPDLALRLLLAATLDEARVLALEIEGVSEQRKALDRALLVDAVEALSDPGLAALPVIVLGKPSWHQGVVGIVAGRLASRFGKPTIVVGGSAAGEGGTTGRGSVRGPPGFPLHDALSLCAGALLGFGGHQAAAGVHVAWDKLDLLRDQFAEACTRLGASCGVRAEAPVADALLDEDDDPFKVLTDFERLEPCGQANPAPRLGIEGARVRSAREVKGGHLQIEISTGRALLRGFGVDMGALAPAVGSNVRAIGKLRHDAYRGMGAVELKLEVLESS
jgi:single-stranded-DNA-specific exonuclease